MIQFSEFTLLIRICMYMHMYDYANFNLHCTYSVNAYYQGDTGTFPIF